MKDRSACDIAEQLRLTRMRKRLCGCSNTRGMPERDVASKKRETAGKRKTVRDYQMKVGARMQNAYKMSSYIRALHDVMSTSNQATIWG